MGKSVNQLYELAKDTNPSNDHDAFIFSCYSYMCLNC